MQSDLPCTSGLLTGWILWLVCRPHWVEMLEPSCCSSGKVNVLRRRNWVAADLETSAC